MPKPKIDPHEGPSDYNTLTFLRDEFARTALEVCVRLFFSAPIHRAPSAKDCGDPGIIGWPWDDYDDMARSCWNIADAMVRNRVKPEVAKIRFT